MKYRLDFKVKIGTQKKNQIDWKIQRNKRAYWLIELGLWWELGSN